MRILKDLSIFNNQKASVFRHSGNTVLSDNGYSGSYRRKLLNIAPFKSVPIYTIFFSKRDSNDFYFQRRLRPDFMSIEFIISGEHYLRCGNYGLVAEAGDMVLLHPFLEHDILCSKGVHCERYGVSISGDKLISLINLLGLDNVNCFKVNDMNRVIKIYEKIHQTFLAEENPSILDANAAHTFELLQIISQLANHDQISKDMDFVIRYFEENLDKKINMRAVAKLIDISLPTFNKRFQEAKNITPYRYLINMRMQHAYELLKSKQYSVKEVAIKTGYDSEFYFSTEFKKFFSQSPSKV